VAQICIPFRYNLTGKHRCMKLGLVLTFSLCWGTILGGGDIRPKDEPNGQNLVIVTLDGFRWQELFGGADSTLLHDPKWTADTENTKALYWDSDPRRRRERLMPFFWNVIARKGQLHGNRELGNNVNTSNFYQISYPGYNEIFTGEADLFISSNKKIRNENKNVLEYLNQVGPYAGQVAAFTSWDAFPFILNRERSGFFLNSGSEAVPEELLSEGGRSLNTILTHPDNKGRPTRDDRITFLSAMEFIRHRQPKVFFLGFSGTDDAGHDKSYDRYLRSAAEADRMIGELWTYLQSQPNYRGNTTLVITTDHGRGSSAGNWYDHGFFVGGSSQTWMAMLGSNIISMGECGKQEQLYQKQVAGTMAWLLGVKSRSRNMLPLTLFTRPETKDDIAAK
jgi:hypothetical protein